MHVATDSSLYQLANANVNMADRQADKFSPPTKFCEPYDNILEVIFILSCGIYS